MTKKPSFRWISQKMTATLAKTQEVLRWRSARDYVTGELRSILSWIRSLGRIQLSALFALVTSLLSILLFFAFGGDHWSTAAAQVLTVSASFVYLFLVIQKLVHQYWHSSIGKASLGIMISVVSVLSYIYSNHLVHATMQESPTFFPHSVTLLTLVSAPIVSVNITSYVISIVAGVMLIFAIVASDQQSLPRRALRLLKRSLTAEKQDQDDTPLDSTLLTYAYSVCFLVIAIYLALTAEKMTQESPILSNLTKAVAYKADFYSHSRCSGLPADARVAYLDGDRVLVALLDTSNNPKFFIYTCNAQYSGDEAHEYFRERMDRENPQSTGQPRTTSPDR